MTYCLTFYNNYYKKNATWYQAKNIQAMGNESEVYGEAPLHGLRISVNHHEFFLLMVREGIDRDPRLIIDIEFPSAYNIPPKAKD